MENWEEEFSDQFFASTEGRNDIRREKIKELILQIRQDTLRQVLPEKLGESTTSYGFGCDDMIKRIINKAKELWGIELNNLNK